MQHLNYLISDLALIMVTAAIVTLIFRKIKLPVVLGYILAGFLISPHFYWIPTVVEIDNINTWANIGIVFLMFGLGLEFSFKKIADVGASAIITATTVMTAMIIVGFFVGKAMGWSQMDSLFLGGMISISSTMIILKAYEEYDLKKEKFGVLVLGTLVIEDIGGIFILIILSTIAVSQNVTGLQLSIDILILLLMLVIWLVLGIYLIPTVIKRVSSKVNNETLLIVVLAICFGMVVISHFIGFSEALGAFMAGSIMAGTVNAEKIDKLITPVKDLFGMIFFVSIGMMVVPDMVVKYIVPIVILTLVTIFGQMLFSTIGMILSGQSLHTSVRGGFSMVQVGEFSFIIATLGISLKVTSDFLLPIIVSVSVITTFTTPFFIKGAESVYSGIIKILPDRALAFLRRYTSEKRSSRDKDQDWKDYLRNYFIKTLITTAALFLVYYMAKTYVHPFMQDHFSKMPANIIATVVTCLIMAPIINLMWVTRKDVFKKLWLKSNSNRLPLMALKSLRLLIALTFIVLVCRALLGAPYWILLLLGIVVIGFIIKSDFLRSSSIKIEARFIANFNERVLSKRKKDEDVWLGDQIYVVEFLVEDVTDFNEVRMHLKERIFNVLIIKIIRDGKHINIPDADEKIYVGDKLTAIGSKIQLEAYIMALEQAEHIEDPEEPMVTLREYTYAQVFNNLDPEDQIIISALPINKTSPLSRKSIKSSKFKKKYHGFIVGIERDNYPIIDPPINTVMEDGDIIWAVGTEEMAKELIKDDMLDV